MTAHDAVTCCLVWLTIGSIVWLALYYQGILTEAYAKRQRVTLSIVFASFAVIVGWPFVAWVFLSSVIEGRRR
ncbi:MAG: hypothetical protein PS018_17275 [bacterium]|nr:hypothetical protein [bacterium]